MQILLLSMGAAPINLKVQLKAGEQQTICFSSGMDQVQRQKHIG